MSCMQNLKRQFCFLILCASFSLILFNSFFVIISNIIVSIFTLIHFHLVYKRFVLFFFLYTYSFRFHSIFGRSGATSYGIKNNKVETKNQQQLQICSELYYAIGWVIKETTNIVFFFVSTATNWFDLQYWLMFEYGKNKQNVK